MIASLLKCDDVRLKDAELRNTFLTNCMRLITVWKPSGQYIVLQARTYGFGTDNIRNESFLDVRVRTYIVRS